MNKYIFAFFLLIFYSACDNESEKYEPFVGSYNEGTIVGILLEDKDGNNLLESTTSGFFTESEIAVDYQNSSFRKLRPRIQRDFYLAETGEGLVLMVSLEPPNALNVPHKDGTSFHETYTYLKLGKNAKSVLRSEYRVALGYTDRDDMYGNSSCVLMRLYYDNILKWEREENSTSPMMRISVN